MASGSLVISWLVGAESSPLNDYFLFHTAIPNLWGTFNLIPYLIALMIALPLGATSHSGFSSSGVAIGFVVMFVYWFVFGYFVVVPFCRLLIHRRRASREST